MRRFIRFLPDGFTLAIIAAVILALMLPCRDEAAHWVANTGVTHLLSSRIQIDIAAGHTLYAHTSYWFSGAGFAIRLDNLLSHAAGKITRTTP